jgi:hypothetical protein
MNKTITKRQDANKMLLIEQLKKAPIVQLVCEKLSIGRATYYRWRKEDKQFAKKADQALLEGKLLINDLAESKLIGAIKDQNMTAIIFWLKNHDSTYSNKVELTHKTEKEELSAEQKKLVKKAISLTHGNTYEE